MNLCNCGHAKSMHPFGHSEALTFGGTCMLCECREFAEPTTPQPRLIVVMDDDECHCPQCQKPTEDTSAQS